MTQSELEENLLFQIKAVKLPIPETNFKFHHSRRWRFDFAWTDRMLAVEVEGGTWISGRHTTGIGFENDCKKYDAAMRLGWKIYRCTGGMVESGQALQTIEILLNETR